MPHAEPRLKGGSSKVHGGCPKSNMDGVLPLHKLKHRGSLPGREKFGITDGTMVLSNLDAADESAEGSKIEDTSMHGKTSTFRPFSSLMKQSHGSAFARTGSQKEPVRDNNNTNCVGHIFRAPECAPYGLSPCQAQGGSGCFYHYPELDYGVSNQKNIGRPRVE